MRALLIMLVLLAPGCAQVGGARSEPAPIEYRSRLGGAPQPGSQAAPQARDEAPAAAGGIADGDRSVEVRAGDTLYSISEHYQVSLRALIDANDLEPPFELARGARLTIPAPNQVEVVRGDTLFSIAQRFRVDLRSLAVMNGLEKPYQLEIGDTVYLPALAVDWGARAAPLPNPQVEPIEAAAPRAPEPSAPAGPGPVSATGRSASAPAAPIDKPAPTPASRPGTARPPAPPAPTGPAPSFIWPHDGKIIATFGETGMSRRNDGVNIAAVEGDPVRAAADGVVVYAGAEMKGYGKLLLIKHAGGWVSAYAHNREFLVKENETVKQGASVASAGSTGAVDTPQVHFELRRAGRPADPKTLLPAR